MIEIVERATCPTCHGDGAVPSGNEYFGQVEMVGCPEGCDDNGDVTRVLATFADAAALRVEIRFVLNDRLGYEGMPADEWDDIRVAVLAALGVIDEN